MSELTVGDELAFDRLDEDTRKLCDKIIAARVEAEVGEWDTVHDRGYQEGYQAAKAAERRKAEQQSQEKKEPTKGEAAD